MIGTVEAARRLGFHESRIRQLIAAGKLPATYIGHSYVLDEAEVARFKAARPVGAKKPTGRPRKNSVKEA